MHVRAEREAGIVMAEPFLDLLDVAAGVEEQRGARMPEDMKAERREAGSSCGWPKHPDA